MKAHPYEFVSQQTKITFAKPKRTFIILIYGAYNAMGLIGCERNGIAILDEDNKQILCDEICKELTGYNGPSIKQMQEYHNLLNMSWNKFKDFVNTNERSRYQI